MFFLSGACKAAMPMPPFSSRSFRQGQRENTKTLLVLSVEFQTEERTPKTLLVRKLHSYTERLPFMRQQKPSNMLCNLLTALFCHTGATTGSHPFVAFKFLGLHEFGRSNCSPWPEIGGRGSAGWLVTGQKRSRRSFFLQATNRCFQI